MQLIDSTSAQEYLRQSGRIEPDAEVRVRELTGGVSNQVLLIEHSSGNGLSPAINDTFVLKQARAQLRTSAPWYCSVDRIWREIRVLEICDHILKLAAPQPPDASLRADTPRVLFEDRDNFLFAMTAAPMPHEVWKSMLLEARASPEIAGSCGWLLATLHGGTWNDATIAHDLDDQQVFDSLRIDPYYRTIALRHSDLSGEIGALIKSMLSNRRCLVHADFSPKNLLVHADGLMMVDFETGHFGDPAFDIGFFLSHLVLKSFYHAPDHEPFLALAREFWDVYFAQIRLTIPEEETSELKRRGALHLAGCALARIDGKSPVDYLSDTSKQEAVRRLCCTLFTSGPNDWDEIAQLCLHTIENNALS